jgi:hypothetical protein
MRRRLVIAAIVVPVVALVFGVRSQRTAAERWVNQYEVLVAPPASIVPDRDDDPAFESYSVTLVARSTSDPQRMVVRVRERFKGPSLPLSTLRVYRASPYRHGQIPDAMNGALKKQRLADEAAPFVVGGHVSRGVLFDEAW